MLRSCFLLSNEVWKNPELNFKEFKAHELLTNFLEKEGFTVELRNAPTLVSRQLSGAPLALGGLMCV